MPSLTSTGLDGAVAELHKIALGRGKLVAADLALLRQHMGLGATPSDRFFDRLVDVISSLPGKDPDHARLLLRLTHGAENLTHRRDIASSVYRVRRDGSARSAAEKYVFAQIIYGLGQSFSGLGGRGQGYEVMAARFRYWFFDNNPDELRVDAELDLLAVRDDVRVFTFGSDPTSGTFYDIRCVSEDAGHRLLRKVPIRATAPKGEHYTFFYLGGDLKAGDTPTLALSECWDNSDDPALREHGVAPASGGGPLLVTLDAPKTVVSHYAIFAEPYERARRPAPRQLVERVDDEPIVISEEAPRPGHIYGFWYKVVPRD